MAKIPSEIGEKYITAWQKAATLLEEVRASELPLVNTTQGLLSLLPAFEACVKARQPSNTSGLIEQQKIFCRLLSR